MRRPPARSILAQVVSPRGFEGVVPAAANPVAAPSEPSGVQWDKVRDFWDETRAEELIEVNRQDHAERRFSR